jgi:glutamyl-tRNA(Gln) amidotransferase subunit E
MAVKDEISLASKSSDGYVREFECLAEKFPELSGTIAKTFLNTIPELEREGVDLGWINTDVLLEIFSNLSKGRFAKEAIPDVLKEMSEKGVDLEKVIEKFGSMSMEEVREFIRKVVSERMDFIRERGMSALSPIMGVVMKELRGRVDGKVVSEILKEEIKKVI